MSQTSEISPEKRKPKKPIPKKDERAKKVLNITLKKESPQKPPMLVPSPRSVPSQIPLQRTPNVKITPLYASSKETTPKNANDRLYRPSPMLTPSPQSKKTTPTKNLANNRLSQLRAQLDAEIQSRTDDSARSSPKPIPSEIKTSISESPLNESRVSTTQSPSSDSIQSMPSPSQFLAANKIISSMKAQLPEEYCGKMKQKDTFADIEQGIYNQTAEYPSLKHPATPPQFSEASKLVSAIKSKLSYKVPDKDTPVNTFMSAKKRMEALRNRLSSDIEQDDSLIRVELPKSEAMDTEDCQLVKYI